MLCLLYVYSVNFLLYTLIKKIIKKEIFIRFIQVT